MPEGSSLASLSPVPGRAGVLGGGRMGAGVAHAFLLAGSHVVVAESGGEAAGRAAASIRAAVATSAERGSLSEPVDSALSRLQVGVGAAALRDCALVVEAVPEDPSLKLRMLSEVESVLADDAVLATNTSSMSIDELALGLGRPTRFLGMHFFNPVPTSSLVEIVVGGATDTAVVTAAEGWVRHLGKTPITVRDSPGFASSRLGLVLGLEAVRMVEEAVAPAADIDAAMTLGYKHPVGPLRLTDLVGLDVRLGVAEYLASTLGPRFEPPALLREMVARGDLGRKTGQGFYTW